MRVVKKLFAFICVISLYLSIASPAYSEGEFSISFDVTYSGQTSGETLVSQKISITNLFSSIYATSYSLILEGSKPINVKAQEGQETLPVDLTSEGNQTKITISFPNPVVGKGKTRVFSINYELLDAAFKNGNVWEITIPKVLGVERFTSYNLSLSVPTSFGKAAYISPEPKASLETGQRKIFSFAGEQLEKAGIVAAFGDFQIFDFKLFYHIRNPLTTIGETEIALPPDTAFQRVYYRRIEPKPVSIRLDSDGNWLARYRLTPGRKIDIEAAGVVQIFASPQSFYPQTKPQDLTAYLRSTKYWQSSNSEIKTLAARLETPQDIYNYVVGNLSYDYSRVKEGVERLGAVGALQNPQSAICMEFTDLFITLARASGIPAREVNGFAYTDNPQIQPLSLVADVLHAWPEYWDEKKGVWIPVDPTWGNTTGGVDYFSKLDLNHFTFAIHGKDPESPYPAGSYKLAENPQKDVIVSFGTIPEVRLSKPTVNFKNPSLIFPFAKSPALLRVENNGPTALYNLKLTLTSSGLEINKTSEEILFVAPFSSYEVPIEYKLSSFFDSKPAEIQVLVDGSYFAYNIPKQAIVTSRIFGFFLALAAGLLVILFIFKKTKLAKNEQAGEDTKKPWRLPFQK